MARLEPPAKNEVSTPNLRARRTILAAGAVVYGVFMFAVAYLVRRLGLPDQTLVLFLLPPLIAGYFYGRLAYLPNVLMVFVVGMWLTENFNWERNDSKLTIVTVAASMLLLGEGLSRIGRYQRRTQHRLRESEQALRSVLEQAGDAIFVLTDDGAITRSNPAATRILGYTQRELETMAVPDIDLDWDSGQPLDMNEVRKVLPVTLERKYRHKDGRIVYGEARISEYVMRRKSYLLAIVRDITQRIESEAKLREAEAIHASIMESVPDYFMMLDPDYTIKYINRTVPGLTVEGVVNTSIFDYIEAKFHPEMRACFDQVRETHEMGTYNVVYAGPGDENTYFECRVAPVVDDGEITALIINAIDVTSRHNAEADRAALEEKMRQAQKLESLGVLAGGIAHDFNNLLQGVLGNADLILMELDEDARIRRNMNDIVAGAQRAADLCSQLLAYSGRGKFVIERVDLGDIVEDITHLLELTISKKADLRIHRDETLPLVEADTTQLRQIVMNLITNASDALQDRPGTITVRTTVQHCDGRYLQRITGSGELAEGDYVCLEVADTGCGMDADTLAKIFDPFFSTKTTGRGLGLAAVMGIVRGHDGAIEVKSEPGEGTVFKVHLPVAASVYRPVAARTEELRPAEIAGTILVVDDEKMIRDLVQHALEKAGLEVITAEDGQDAVERFIEHKDCISCVLLDMAMPRLSGAEAFREMRRIDPAVPVVLTSGYDEEEAAKHLTGDGLAGFIQKPYRVSDLIAMLERALARNVAL